MNFGWNTNLGESSFWIQICIFGTVEIYVVTFKNVSKFNELVFKLFANN